MSGESQISNIERTVNEIIAKCRNDPARTEIAKVNFIMLIETMKKYEKGPKYYNAIMEESDIGFGLDTGLGYGKNITYYGTWIRLVDNIEKYYSSDSKGAPNAYPTFYCTSVNDCYTSSSELYGVNVLKYPIASITMDDAVFAGAGYKEQNANDSTYIYNGTRFHLIGFPLFTTKNSVTIPVCNMMGVHSLGNGWITCGSRGNFAVRPVINVKGDLIVTAGNGSKNSPYFLETYS